MACSFWSITASSNYPCVSNGKQSGTDFTIDKWLIDTLPSSEMIARR